MKGFIQYIAASLLVFSAFMGCTPQARQSAMRPVAASPMEEAGVDALVASATTDTLHLLTQVSSFSNNHASSLVGRQQVTTSAPAVVAADNVSLLIDSGAVSRDVEISILATTEENSGEIPANMANLTADGAVYRMLPDGQQFEKDITIALRYDSTALPYGYTADDIYTFFYNEQTHIWQQVERDSVDTQNQIVYSRTNHFTDYINGVLKVPESSDAMAYTPTSIKALKAADPMEGITLIAPPEANNQGTANLSYPLNIPAGRHGMQPHLSINYSSASGSGILGLGWSLPISEISVETRWGVPLYDHRDETEGYLLDGTTLVTSYLDENNNLRLNKPVYHRAYEPRFSSDTVRFYPRVEGSFRKIERIGTSPDNYHWMVTDKDGTRHYYGLSNQTTLRDHNRNIAKWMLEKSVDTYGNTVTYTYVTKYVTVPNQLSAKQLCIDRIRYTGIDGSHDHGQYIIRFNYVDKHDKSNSFRYGLEEINNFILERVEVMFRDTIVREYYFGYTEGEFGKTLLCKIYEGYDDSARCQQYIASGQRNTIRNLSAYERCNVEPYDKNTFIHIFHSFDYYGLESGSLFADGVAMEYEGNDSFKVFDYLDSVLYERRNFSGSGSLGWNVYGGLNVGADYIPWLKTVSAGGHYSYSEDYAEGFLQLVDINGDGYPDKLYKSISGDMKCRPQIPGKNKFDAPVAIHGISSFQHTESSTHNYGWEASAAIVGTGKSWSDGRSNTSVYVSDVNGDGLIDIVDNGRVFINRGNFRFKDVTDNDTIHVGGTCDDDVIDFSGEVDPTIFDDGYYTVERVECATKQREIPILDTVYNADGSYEVILNGWQMDVEYDSCWTVVDTFFYTYPKRYEPDVDLVRMWKAPYSGRVSVSGIAKLTDALRDFRAETRTTDGVWVSVQRAGETTPRASATVLPDNPASLACQIDIDEGDTIFFRINALDKRLYDQVEWTPHIEYLSASHRNNVSTFLLSRVDANGDYMYKFDYATDYLLTEHQSVSIGPESGSACTNTFSVACKIKANQPLSQDMTYSLVRSNINNTGSETVINSTTFNQGTSPNVTLTWNATNVPSSQKLVLRLSPVGGGQLNWSDIDADATVTLTHSSDATINARLSDNDARDAYVYHPAVERVFYDYLVFPGTTVTGISGSPNMGLGVTRNDGTPFTGYLYLTVKDFNNSSCFRKNVLVLGGSATISTSPFSFSSGTNYSIDCYTANPTVADHISNIKVTVGGSTFDAGLYAKYGPDTCKHHGTLYRGWGQFGYKSPDSTSIYINSNWIHADSYYTDSNSVPRPSSEDIDGYDVSSLDPDGSPEEIPGGSLFNPLSGTFFEMHVDAGKARWKSYANLVTASKSLSSLDNTDPVAENGQTATVNMVQSPLPVVTPGAKMKAVNKFMLNKGSGYTKKKNAHSEGCSRLLGDFMDLNGDRYPDNVSEKVIQYSRAQGGLGSKTYGYSESAGVNRTENTSDGKANNGTFLNTVFENVPNAKKSRMVSVVSGLFQLLTGGNDSTVSTDITKNTFMDINGDGLADIVYSDGTVKYNMGYRFSGLRTIPTSTIRSSRSVSRAKGFGFNVGNTSISGSIGRNKSDNKTTFVLMDVNGDGLPDMVSPSSIQINMGDGTFNPYGFVGIDNSSSTAFSLNITGTYDAVFSIFGFPLKVGGSAGGGGTASFSHSGAEFVDMNNDGYVDYVYRSGNNIMVRYSNIGRANLLKSVSNVANAGFQIDYEQSTASVDCPQRHWNMASLSVYDGHDGDGVSWVYKRFDYGNRHYDRFERDDYGYDTVKTYDYATQSAFNTNSVGSRYRTSTQDFYNDNYYHAHLKKRDRVSKGNAYVETRYSYADADLVDGHYLGGGTPAWCEGDGWPAVAVEESFHNEGTGGTIATKREYTYGSFGNIADVADFGDIADPSDDYTVHINYALDPARYIVANVSVLDIPGYRHREATYTTEGSLEKLFVDNSPNPQSVFFYEYDPYGNVEKVTTPATQFSSGNNYWIRYTYDLLTNTLPVSVTNAEGHSSAADYSLRWQKPVNTYDIAGNQMHYAYDCHGRTDTIIAPKEITGNIPYTVKYDYWYNQRVDIGSQIYYNYTTSSLYYLWARTHNYDPQHPSNDINTVTFSDGLGRIIQVKKDVDMAGTEVRAVGGTAHYDGLGRKCKEFLLKQESDLQVFDTLLNVLSVQWQVQYDYDYLDRIVKTDYADGTSTSNTYSIAADAGGTLRFLNDATDQNNHTSHIFTNPRQLNMQFTDALGGTTRFHYDAIGQLLYSIDPESDTTTHTYDLGGHRTDRTHPSAGHTHWDYDAAGNMVKQTQNSGEFINYEYNYSRPVHIKYSDRPWNNVWYEYGPANSGNLAGRLVRQQDATGVQVFEYDDMGNMVFNRHTYVQPNSANTFTLETQWIYDSWGRVLGILYPDREDVRYSYDLGGNVCHIEGTKPGLAPTPYIDKLQYDLYEQRVYQVDGNGVESHYSYDPLNRRLAYMFDHSPAEGFLQSIKYTYDHAGNIKHIDDGGHNIRNQYYEYDNINRLVWSHGDMSCQGISLSYYANYEYSAAGRMMRKEVHSIRSNNQQPVYNVDYINDFDYHSHNPFAVKCINGGSGYCFKWDANGNMVHADSGKPYSDRRLCWTEDNKLQGYTENSEETGEISAWYNYDDGGERNFKITSPKLHLRQNAVGLRYAAIMKYPTLYASALITFNRGGYTKHYFEGSNRICSKIGGGFSDVDWGRTIERLPEMQDNYEHLSKKQRESVYRTFEECLGIGVVLDGVADLYDVIKKEHERREKEPAFYYHSDHLGSAAYLTNDVGQITQTLNYLPYGEDWVDRQEYHETRYPRLGQYTFNGKEKDYESGFHYYGARYYWSEVLTGWLSVDPMADKYPSISPYAYCAWNPVKLVDPNGMEFDGYEGSYGQYQWFDKHTEQSFVDENGVKWNKVTNDQNAWEEATTIREANIQGLESLGYKRSDAERDVRLYDGKDPLFTKESHLLNSQNYTSGWETAINSDEGNAKQSPEIKKTGYSLKFYPNKGGRKGANSLGIVQTNGLGHIFEAAMEAFERKICGSSADSDPLYDMHYTNATGLIKRLNPPPVKEYQTPLYFRTGGMK